MDHVLVIAEASNNRTFLMRGAAAAFIDFEQCVNCLLQAAVKTKSLEAAAGTEWVLGTKEGKSHLANYLYL